MFKTKNGGYGFEVMSVESVRIHAKKYSQSYNSSYSPWKQNFEEMAKKTVLKKALKYAPLKSDFIKGVMADESIKNELSEDMFSIESVPIEEYVVDESTGEVKEAAEIQQGIDSLLEEQTTIQ